MGVVLKVDPTVSSILVAKSRRQKVGSGLRLARPTLDGSASVSEVVAGLATVAPVLALEDVVTVTQGLVLRSSSLLPECGGYQGGVFTEAEVVTFGE